MTHNNDTEFMIGAFPRKEKQRCLYEYLYCFLADGCLRNWLVGSRFSDQEQLIF